MLHWLRTTLFGRRAQGPMPSAHDHPDFVRYVSGELNRWVAQDVQVGERSLEVMGESTDHPTTSQVECWREITSRLPELVQTAIEAVPAPPGGKAPPAEERFTLSAVRLGISGDFVLVFDFDPEITHEDYDLAAFVEFVQLIVVDAYWTV